MNPVLSSQRPLLTAAMLAWVLAFAMSAAAEEATPNTAATPAVESTTTPAAATEAPVEATVEATVEAGSKESSEDHHTHEVILRFNKDTTVGAQETVDAVVTISGSSTTAGRVREGVVSVFGNTHVTGPVGEAAVAIFGDVFVNSEVRGDVVAVFGNIELGPLARIGGDVVMVGGEQLTRDPAATIQGEVQQVTLPVNFGHFEWLRPWVSHCLLLGRPLAFEPGLGWAWTLALGFLALYVVLALMFSSAVETCVKTIETRPGRTLVASLLTLLLTPILTVLLAITVVGGVLIPFVWIGLFFTGLFGKAVILGALGRRLTRSFGSGPLADIGFAVLLGGGVVVLLYTVPVLGFILWKVLGILGLGVVVYTLLMAAQERRENQVAAKAASIPTMTPASDAAASDAAAATSGIAASDSPSANTIVPDTVLPRAGFWIRIGALLIDAILIGVAFSMLKQDGIYLPALAAYGAFMWKFKSTTVGGIVCNLKVVRADGRELDWSTAIVRALSCFLSLAVAGLGFLWIVFDDNRQAWHDKIAGTVVVRTPRGVSLV